MKTDDLLNMLGNDRVAESLPGAVLWRWLVPAALFSFAAMALGLGVRFPLSQNLFQPEILPKFVLPLMLGLLAAPLALRFARPLARPRLAWLWVIPMLGMALLAFGYLTTPSQARMMAFTGKTILPCLVSIPALSAPLLAAFLMALRRGAVLAPARAGLIAGLAAGGLGTAIYALHCTEDSPLFYVVWYGAGILITAGVGALIGRKVLRW
ncbi:NrsF family protein [Thioclava sp.]|uniref:NrsF family protein n=1 Tax=Thioclava sp. TaxID=1933450 RepID=UPI003AA94C3A